ncbi:NAD-dependent succinate-semialdehyde dehydrogenase [Paraburkholderia bengalensis]|uniref:NAD-dependent succinate-semialdehyde dehydrogenase n=1 Tax=Paraburkholderia bengalensis TaxID=2747562 RepID=A0ABU8J0E4_9BURK
MAHILHSEENEIVAESSVRTHRRLFIDGAWIDATGHGHTEVCDPVTGKFVSKVVHASEKDLRAAVEASRAGFVVWRDRSAFHRCKIIRSAANLLRERAPQIARLMTREQGKPLKEAGGEIALSADLLDWFAEEGRRTYGRMIPARVPGVSQVVSRVPVGPVAAFTPSNFPIAQAVRKIGPALAAGCSIVLKPAEETAATTSVLADVFRDAGLPPGALNLLYGDPTEISEHLISHPVIRFVSFTGAMQTGKAVAAIAGMHMKRCLMELSGHAPAIIFNDAEIDAAAKLLAFAKYYNSGQACVSPIRFLVQSGVYDDFKDQFIAEVKRIHVANGISPGSTMGPLTTEQRLRFVQDLIDDAIERGATVELGGKRIGDIGHFLEPTVLSNVTVDMRIMNEEPFGPVALLSEFETVEQAIKEANRVPHGLASYAFTRSNAIADHLSSELETGMLSINHLGLGLPETPYGGVKASGYGSEGGTEALDNYLVTKFVSHAVM